MKTNIFLFLVLFLTSSAFAQSTLLGNWKTGEENTIVSITETEGVLSGLIVSSDNKNARIGKPLIRNIKADGKQWKGELYAAKKEKWINADFKVEKTTLFIDVKVGFLSKTFEWNKVNDSTDSPSKD